MKILREMTQPAQLIITAPGYTDYTDSFVWQEVGGNALCFDRCGDAFDPINTRGGVRPLTLRPPDR
jgi:hypothetical protein